MGDVQYAATVKQYCHDSITVMAEIVLDLWNSWQDTNNWDCYELSANTIY